MSVREVKSFNPPVQIAVSGWKWFVLHRDGTLGTLLFPVPSYEPNVKLSVPMESEHGYWLFTDKKQADAYAPENCILVEVDAVGLMAHGKVSEFDCSKFQSILIRLTENPVLVVEASEVRTA